MLREGIAVLTWDKTEHVELCFPTLEVTIFGYILL